MPVKNWERKQEIEDSTDYEYVWENTETYSHLRIYRDAFETYHIEIRTSFNGEWRFYDIEGFGTKENARKYSVQIQENFPELKGVSVTNRIRNGRKGFERKSVEKEVSPWISL